MKVVRFNSNGEVVETWHATDIREATLRLEDVLFEIEVEESNDYAEIHGLGVPDSPRQE